MIQQLIIVQMIQYIRIGIFKYFMMDQQNSPQLTIKQIKTYSRKQLKVWVNQSQYTFDSLNNGLFFLSILQKLVPQQTNKKKIYGKANNGYEYIYNLNLIKKILNKYGLQKDLDTNTISQTKNCFELANWFKNLYEQNKNQSLQQLPSQFIFIQKSFTPSKFDNSTFKSPGSKHSLSRATSSDLKAKNSTLLNAMELKNNEQKNLNKHFFNTQKLAPNILGKEQLYKTTSNIFQRNKSQSVLKKKPIKNYIKQVKPRKQSFMQQKIKLPKPPKQEQKVSKLDFSNIGKNNKDQSYLNIENNIDIDLFGETSDIMSLMKKQSLKDSIKSYSKILLKVQDYIRDQNKTPNNILELRQTIHKIIYLKQ